LPIRISPETFAQSSDDAVRRKARDGEKEMPLAYEGSTAIPQGSRRFANQNPTARELVAQYIEDSGGLGAVADNKKFAPGQRYFLDFVTQLQKGPFSLGLAPEEVA
jgi:hypothetical protein